MEVDVGAEDTETVGEQEFSANANTSAKSTSDESNQDELREKDAEIAFLKSTNQGLQEEVKDLESYLEYLHTSHGDLIKEHKLMQSSYAKLQVTSDKDTEELTSRLNHMQQKVDELANSKGKFFLTKAKKPYHDLSAAQKSVVHRQVRETVAPKIDELLEDRKLCVSLVVLKDVDGKNPSVKINTQPHRTFDQLTDAERQTVAELSDSNAIHRTSNASYAAKRKIIKDLPPLTHLQRHNENVASSLPPIRQAPGREGGFLPIRTELKQQIEHLDKLGKLDSSETVYVKYGLDSTRLTHNVNCCVYSAETISASTEIGLVGAVDGGDSHDDMDTAAPPFFEQIKELDKNPVIQTDIGDVKVELRGGGDLCNIYQQLGLCNATSKHNCPCCVLPKASFWETADNEELLRKCNGPELGRTRSNIMNEAKQTKPNFSVKNMPQTPLPRNPNGLIITWMVLCMLHAVLRLTG